MMGIVHHAVYPIWYEIGRNDFFDKCGYGFEKTRQLGIDPAMVNLELSYARPVTYPGTVTVRTRPILCEGKKLSLRYEVFFGNSETPVATAKSFHIWVKGGKSLNLESEVPEMFSAYNSAVEPE